MSNEDSKPGDRLSVFAQLQREAMAAQNDILRAINENQNAIHSVQGANGSFMNDSHDAAENAASPSKPADSPSTPASTRVGPALSLNSLQTAQQHRNEMQQIQHEHEREQIRAVERQARFELQQEHSDAMRVAAQKHTAEVLGLEMRVNDLEHQLQLQEQLQADVRSSAQQASAEMQKNLNTEMQTMVAHMTEANEALSAHFEEVRHEKEILRAEHAVAQQTWRDEMDKLTQSYKSLIADCKQRHSAEQESALQTVAELRQRSGDAVSRVKELAKLQQAHDAAASQVELLQRECDALKNELHQANALRKELDAAKEALSNEREEARMAAVQSRLQLEREAINVEEHKRQIAELQSKVQTLQLQNDGLKHRLELVNIQGVGRDGHEISNVRKHEGTTSPSLAVSDLATAANDVSDDAFRELRQENTRLQAQLTHVETVRQTLMKEIESRAAAEVDIQRDHAREKEQIRSDFMAKIRTLEASLKEAAGSAVASSLDETNRVQNLLAETAELRNEVVALRAAAAREQEHHRGVLAENHHLLSTAQNDVATLQQTLQQSQSTITSLENSLRAAREDNARNAFDGTVKESEKVAQLSSALRDATQQALALQEQVDAKNIEIETLRAQIEEWERKCSSLTQELEVAKQLQTDMNTLRSELDAANALADQYKSQAERLASSVTTAEEDAEQQLQQEREARVQELDQLKSELSTLRDNLNSRNAELDTAETKLKDFQARERELQTNVVNLQSRVDELQQLVDDSKALIASQQQDLDTLKQKQTVEPDKVAETGSAEAKAVSDHTDKKARFGKNLLAAARSGALQQIVNTLDDGTNDESHSRPVPVDSANTDQTEEMAVAKKASSREFQQRIDDQSMTVEVAVPPSTADDMPVCIVTQGSEQKFANMFNSGAQGSGVERADTP